MSYNEPMFVRVNRIAIVALLVFVLLAPLIVFRSGQAETLDGGSNALRQVVYIAIFAMALFSAHILRFPAALLTPPLTVRLMLLWCGLSVFWAINPSVSVRRLFLTLIIVWSIFLLVEKAGYEETVKLIRWVLLITLFANYLAVLTVPSLAIHQAMEEDPSIVGSWSGLLMSKNFAGPVCALTILFFTFDAKKIYWPWRLIILVGAAIFLYQSNSKTSMGVLASSFFVIGLYRLYNPYYRWVLCVFVILGSLLVGLLANEYWELITEPFYRPDSLTGRVQIWPVLVRYWQDHWLLGSGFGSFWNIGEPKPISLYSRGWVTGIASGHNGFLDLLVQTGLPGLVLAIFATVLAPLSKFIMNPSLTRSRASLLLACIWFGIGHNFTESSMFDRDAIVHVFLMLSIALLTMEVRNRSI